MYANPALPSVVCFMKLFCLITLPYRGGDSDYYISCCLYLIPHVCVTFFSFARVLYASRNRCRSKQGTPRVSKITFIKNATMANRSSVLYSTFSKWNVSHVIGHTAEQRSCGEGLVQVMRETFWDNTKGIARTIGWRGRQVHQWYWFHYKVHCHAAFTIASPSIFSW